MNKASESHSTATVPDGEFGIYREMDHFPATDCPAYLQQAVGGVCMSGSMTLLIFDMTYNILPGMVITLLPWQLVSVKEISPDFSITFFKISREMFTETLSAMWRLRPGFFFYMRRHAATEPTGESFFHFLDFCDRLSYWNEHAPANCRRETIMHLLRFHYWTIYSVYLNDPDAEKSRYTHKEEIAFRFMQLIIETHSPDKDVSHYAERLGVSPKYLTNLIRSISGHSARDWIVYFTIIEIKSLLRESALDLKSITIRTNFPDQSTMSRFFRHYAGMSPTQYRERNHF